MVNRWFYSELEHILLLFDAADDVERLAEKEKVSVWVVSAAAKAKCWKQVAERGTAVSGIQRSAVDVKRKFVYEERSQECISYD